MSIADLVSNNHASFDVLGVKSFKSISSVPYIRDQGAPCFPGSYSTVFKAETASSRLFRSDRKSFAVKEIHFPDPNSHQQAAREIEHLRLCKHPNILRLTDAYTIEQKALSSTIFLVTEPWAPVSLQKFFEDLVNSQEGRSALCPWYTPHGLQPWPSMIEQCVDGLKYLHEKSIRHKDLKPPNILLVDESRGEYHYPRVKPIIADLGISKKYIPGADTSFQGTYQYLAPEQIDRIESTPKSDIFSLGCCFAMIEAVLHSGQKGLELVEEAATGVGPCQFGMNLFEIHKILDEPAISSQTATSSETSLFRPILRTLVSGMMTSNSAKRPSIDEVHNCLMEYDNKRRLHENQKFLELCITTGNVTSLLEIDISHVKTDEQLHQELWSRYEEHHRNMRGLLASLYKPISANLIQFSLCEDRVKMINYHGAPSFEAINSRSYDRIDRSYPAGLCPGYFLDYLIDRRLFVEFYLSGSIPKKLGRTMKQDQAKVGDKSLSGWGVEITDGLSVSRVLLLLFTLVWFWKWSSYM
jgi:serine/threonine protein kinase